MQIVKVDTISGFPENLPEIQIIEDRFKDIIRKNYLLSGFNSLDTSIIEREDVLCAKGADDNEIYGIHRINGEVGDDKNLGLRFDLTVPLARYVVLNQEKLAFPFKRFCIGRVYRGERAQKGRYREFYQADVDIIGNEKLSFLADSEIISTIYNTLKELGIGDFTININNKKFLIGFLKSIGIGDDKIVKVISIIDKKDKLDRVDKTFPKTKEVLMGDLRSENGEDITTEKKVSLIIEMILLGEKGDLYEIVKFLEQNNPTHLYKEGIDSELNEGMNELKELYNSLFNLGVSKENLKINPSISRGLAYYTGTVFETFITGYESMGSIASGGRYENLASNFTKQRLPGVGGSIGLSRLMAVLDEIGKLQTTKKTESQVLVLNLDERYLKDYLSIVKSLRNSSINTEIYFEVSKMDKQLKYAEKKGVKYAIIMGEQEKNNGTVAIKDLEKREQNDVKLSEVIEFFEKNKQGKI